jgi:hypothetical protein
MPRKITIKLSEKAEKYFNEVIYSIDFGTGKEPTISDAVNYIIEILSDIEDCVGDPVTFLGQYKTFEEVEPNPKNPSYYGI